MMLRGLTVLQRLLRPYLVISLFLMGASGYSPTELSGTKTSGSGLLAEENYTILVSFSPDRSNPVPLEGQAVSGNIFAFTSPDTGVERVRFYLDDPNMAGRQRQVEENPPYDFRGGTVTAAIPFSTTTLADGPHIMTVALVLSDGSTAIVHASFNVANSSSALVFNPNSLSVVLAAGGTSQHTVTLQNSTGAGFPYTAADDADWLMVTPESGLTPAELDIAIDTTDLVPGSYNAAVTANASTSSAVLPVLLTVGSDELPGDINKWETMTIDFQGPQASELGTAPNPFLDYRLQVTLTSPTGRTYNVPGFFDGDGNGNGAGNVWRVRFTPDETGAWSYRASYRAGPNIAVDLNPNAGAATGFDGSIGTFTVSELDPNAPGFFKWGRLEYVGTHYLKFRDGPYWIKGGTDSPETFFGYSGFDNTPAGPVGLLDFENHVQDWKPGDPDWGNGQGKGMIGVLNYFGSQHINSVYFLPMNIGGDGRNTWPYAGTISPNGNPANDNLHFDISKLRQWDIVFNHAQRNGVELHLVLNEAERANKNELDNATLGVERKFFYRELIARFGHNNALQWNISEEYDYELPLSPDTVKRFAEYIQAVDPYDHPITVHNNAKPDVAWTPFLGDPRFSITSFQYTGGSVAAYGEEVEKWRAKTSDAGRPLPISLDEFRATTTTNYDAQRKELIWPTYLSGGNMEFYIGGAEIDKTLDNFRTYEPLWNYSRYARKFLEENLPFWEMEPQDELLTGEASDFGGGQVFAKAGAVYAVYLPKAGPTGTLDLSGASGNFVQRWYNPRNGSFEGSTRNIAGGSKVDLGPPPSAPAQDWAVLIQGEGSGDGSPTILRFTLINAETDQPLYELQNNSWINFERLPTNKLSIRVDTVPEVVGSVRFGWNNNPNYRTENTHPYTIAGDVGGDYNPWTPVEGIHQLTATPYSAPNGLGTPGIPRTITITVSNGALYQVFFPELVK